MIVPSQSAFLSSAIADSSAVAFTDTIWPNNPFHKGEVALQQLSGTQEYVMSYAPQFIRPNMPEQHRIFFAAQPFLVAAVRDSKGAMWATLLERSDWNEDDNNNDSAPVVVTASPDDQTLILGAQPVAGDALEGAFSREAAIDVGILGIEFDTARRNRVTGRATINADGTTLTFNVDQSFGNCPQYIKPRSKWFRAAKKDQRSMKIPHIRSNTLNANQVAWIQSAETLFTASGYRGAGEDIRYGNDASHRGGPAGFVQVIQHEGGPAEIVWTEFKGNNHFNSLGNILLDPRVGLAFPDFSTGGLLQVTGTAVVEMGSLENGGRKVRMQVDAVNELPAGSFPIRWNDDAFSNVEMQVANIVQESVNVKSFYFKPMDSKKELRSYKAGQHLPIELTLENGEVVQRSYSLSATPKAATDGYYRISVKHEPQGKASSYLHEHIKIGDRLIFGKPAGSFTRNSTPGTTVLLSSGIGITPMLSMLHEIAEDKDAKGEVVWIHGAQNGHHYALRNEVDTILNDFPHRSMKHYTVFSQPEPSDEGYDFSGRITADYLLKVVPNLSNAKFYMCGPLSFLADLETGLQALGVDSQNIRYETF